MLGWCRPGSARTIRRAAAERVAFATAALQEVERRKRAASLFTYDDMLTRLRDALADADHGQAAAERLRRRYRIVMVDEFQDTDPIQWEILRRAFHHHSTLILIGDPKQAIYAFRGADVFTYLDAVQQADHVRSLSVNRRSDQSLVDALAVLMGDAALGDERIAVRPVTAEQQHRRLSAPAGQQHIAAPIRLRVMPHEVDAEKVPSVATIRPQIADDLIADITALLGSGARLREAGGCPSGAPVRYRRSGSQEPTRRGDPRKAGVCRGACRDVRRQLGVRLSHGAGLAHPALALEQTRQGTVRQVALTCFFGWTFADLAAATEESMIELTQRVRWWGKVLESRGVAALLETATSDEQIPERLLRMQGGERMLTDLRHLGQSLHAAMTSSQLGVGALVEWLRARMTEARHNGMSEVTRRLETDAKAVTILTVHRSKGLEFPIVYLPEAWDRHANGSDEGRILRLHEPTATSSGECVLDVGGRLGPGSGRALLALSGRGVRRGSAAALRRADPSAMSGRDVVGTALSTPGLGAAALCISGPGDPPAPRATYPLRGDPFTGRELGPGFSVEEMASRELTAWRPVAEPQPALGVRSFDRELDVEWRRTSYSGLTAAVHGTELPIAAVGSEPDLRREDDESAPDAADGDRDARPPPPAGGLDQPSPMHDLPSGSSSVPPCMPSSSVSTRQPPTCRRHCVRRAR